MFCYVFLLVALLPGVLSSDTGDGAAPHRHPTPCCGEAQGSGVGMTNGNMGINNQVPRYVLFAGTTLLSTMRMQWDTACGSSCWNAERTVHLVMFIVPAEFQACAPIRAAGICSRAHNAQFIIHQADGHV